MAMKEEKKFILIERDIDKDGPFIVEDQQGIVYFNDYNRAKEYAITLSDPAIINLY